jgi:uncharacterized protein (UPF0332 family)
MSIERLVKEGSVHPFRASREEIAKIMGIAKRDLAEAESITGTSLDWTYAIAYNAVLQACRAYMFHLGYRPASSMAHKATFEFMQITVDEPMKKTMDYFDRARKKRHHVIYEETGSVTETETRQLIKKSKEFLVYVEGMIGGV